ncbi:MAG: hypothetical protein NTX65_12985 [Ignavibacteriales bacterium]|nr:hypothetical protein [Ignavibacteriales bacterium]
MEYSIRYLDDNKIVEIKSVGRTCFKTAELYSKDAIKVAHEHSCSRYLINHTDTDASVNIHSTGEELQQFGFQITDRIAIVIKHSHSFETVSQNSRWSESKYFDNVKEAVNWLVADE